MSPATSHCRNGHRQAAAAPIVIGERGGGGGGGKQQRRRLQAVGQLPYISFSSRFFMKASEEAIRSKSDCARATLRTLHPIECTSSSCHARQERTLLQAISKDRFRNSGSSRMSSSKLHDATHSFEPYVCIARKCASRLRVTIRSSLSVLL